MQSHSRSDRCRDTATADRVKSRGEFKKQQTRLRRRHSESHPPDPYLAPPPNTAAALEAADAAFAGVGPIIGMEVYKMPSSHLALWRLASSSAAKGVQGVVLSDFLSEVHSD